MKDYSNKAWRLAEEYEGNFGTPARVIVAMAEELLRDNPDAGVDNLAEARAASAAASREDGSSHG
jgi:hypothetical protein